MAIGDILNPKRVRWQSNERVDTVDSDAQSGVARTHLDAYSRAVEATPRNVGSTTPTGLIFQGFGLTLNPTGASDAKVRVQSPVGVAFDANGRMLIKEAGVTVDLTLPSGNSQIYVYYIESNSDTAVRRTISVASPYTEGGSSFATKFKADVAFFIRAGDQTSIVASDVVNGATTALCFLGVANNAAGTITMTGYDSVTAPNGAFTTNRLTSVVTPTTLPPANTANGTIATMHGLVNAALYLVGQALWKGSRNFTPSAANNFGAFSSPTAGIDGLFNALAEAVVTPITRWRDWLGNNRALIDHSGYRMGQVTEIDENWKNATSRSVTVPVSSAAHCSGVPFTVNSGVLQTSPGLFLSASTDAFAFAFSWLRAGMTITSVTVDLQIGTNDTVQVQHERVVNGSTSPTGLSVVTVGPVPVNNLVVSLVAAGLGAGTAYPFTVSQSEAHGFVVAANTIATAQTIIWSFVASVIVDPEGWTWSTTNNGSAGCKRQYVDPGVNINQRSVQLLGQGTGAQSGTLSSEAYECFMNADVAYEQEWMLRTGTITDANNTRLFAAGIQNSNAAANNRFVYFYNQNTTANWQLRVVGSATLDTDTGVAIAANTTYRMRLEILGANVSTAGGTSFRVRAFINGAKVVDIVSSTLPAADMIRPYFSAGVTGTSVGAYDFAVGRVRRCWNHLLNGDNV